MVALDSGKRVWLAEAGPPSSAQTEGRELVLCVHGMTGDATNWTDLMAELTPEFAAAAVDLPGSGFSPPPPAMRGYSITAQAAAVVELIEGLNVGPVHLMGNSMGGAVTVRAAARRPDLVRTLTLVSAALPDLRLRRDIAHFPVLALPVFGTRMVRQFARLPAENRIAGVLQTCYYDPAAVHQDRVALSVAELRRRDGLDYDPAATVGAARTLVAETLRPYPVSLWRDAAQLKMPALVLFGSHDKLVSPRLAGRAARTFPDATVIVLPDTGHLGQMEHPATVASLFREMVEKTRARGSEAGNAGHRDPVEA